MKAAWLLTFAIVLAGCATPLPARERPKLETPPALSGIAGDLTRLAEKSSPSVVRIHNKTHVFKPLGRYLTGLAQSFLQVFNPHPWWEWPYRVITFPFYLLFGYLDLGSAVGSGFFVGEGLVLTNAHVVDNAAELRVHLPDGRRALATILRRNTQLDLALLEVEDLKGPPPPALKLRKTATPPGEPVLAIGFPSRETQAGLFGPSRAELCPNPRLTVGVVSAVHVELGNAGTAYVETDAALNPGSSGGPLLGLDGSVVGVCSMIGIGKENEGYAVPAETILATFGEELLPKPPQAPPSGEGKD